MSSTEVARQVLVPPPVGRLQRSPIEVQRSVLFALLLRELKTRFGGRWLGIYWAMLEPLAQIVVLTLLLGALHSSLLPGVDYPVFLLTGIVPFYLFKGLALRLMEGIDANRALFGYRQVKPIDTLLARGCIEVGLYLAISVCMFAAFAALGMAWASGRPLESLLLGVAVVAGGLGLGLALAVATNDFPQSRGVVRILFMPLYFLSGVMAPLHVAPVEWWPVLMLNPLLHMVELSRQFFIPSYRPVEGISAAYVGLCALTVLALGLAVYQVRRHQLLSA
ncbi:MAG: ABC transporter permease [Aquabacterium sp.]|nr:ABC transporter permease [Aquabacterium sp.]